MALFSKERSLSNSLDKDACVFSVTDAFVFDLRIAPRAGILDLCGLPW